MANVQYSTKRFGQCTCRPDRVTREGVIGTTRVFDDEWVSEKEGSVGGEVLVVAGCVSVCGMINSVSKYAGFSRSMEMTFLRPYISTEKCLSWLLQWPLDCVMPNEHMRAVREVVTHE